MEKILLSDYQKRKHRIYTKKCASTMSSINGNSLTPSSYDTISDTNTYNCTYNLDCNHNLIYYQLNENTEKQNDYYQLQINYLNNKINVLENELKNSNATNKYIINEINSIYDLIENNIVNKKKCECKSPSGCVMFSDTSKIHTFVIDFDVKIIFCTMIAGGGAGGIGFIQNYYFYSGGGGGAGASYIKKPIDVKKGSILKIKVGSGGNQSSGKHGEDTWIEVVNGIVKNVVSVEGGKNGCPVPNCEINVSGGKGGKNDYEINCGRDGTPGQISIPSHISALGGNGGNSIFFNGGQGGGNYFNNGGNGGNPDCIIGNDGSYGSGGGGSCPSSKIDPDGKISGNGGNGFVLLEWCCCSGISSNE